MQQYFPVYFFHKFPKCTSAQYDTDRINKWSYQQKQNLACFITDFKFMHCFHNLYVTVCQPCFLFKPQIEVAYLATWIRKMFASKRAKNLPAESWKERVHTEVPLTLQDTDGFGDPSASQTRTLCWPSSPRCLDSCRITGAPGTGCNNSGGPERATISV